MQPDLSTSQKAMEASCGVSSSGAVGHGEACPLFIGSNSLPTTQKNAPILSTAVFAIKLKML